MKGNETDRRDAAELPACIIDYGAVGKAGDESGGIVVVRRPDVGSGNLG